MKIPFITGDAPEGNYPINWYFLPETINGRNAMVGTPGLKPKYDTPSYAEGRDGHVFNGSLYTVVGNTFYRVTSNGTVLNKGTLSSSSGFVQMENNGTQLMIVDGLKGYIYENETLSVITDTDFPTPSFLAYQDGYFIVLEKDTQKFYISGSYDGTAWEALDYSAAEGWPDKARALVMDHRELWVFQDDTTEVFYNSGASDFPFERVPGGFIENGIGAKDSVVKIDNSLVWLDDDFIFRRADGFKPSVISPPKLNEIISSYSVKDDAFAFRHVSKGNEFYVATFPTENKTWAWSALTKAWHQWASGAMQLRHRANWCVKFNGEYLAGDYENGKIYKLDDNTYDDDGAIIKATRISAPVFTDDRVNLFFSELEIEFEQGVGLNTGQGSDPKCMLQWSDDRGKTWSNEHWRSIGKVGRYANRSKWDALGESPERIFKLEITDPVKRTLISANSIIHKGLH